MAQAAATKVVVVDDSSDVRRRLVSIVGGIDGVAVVGDAGSADEGFELCDRLQPDAVILDLVMPEWSSVELLTRVKRLESAPLCIVLANHHFPALRRECQAVGADFLLNKTSELGRVADILTPDLVAGRPGPRRDTEPAEEDRAPQGPELLRDTLKGVSEALHPVRDVHLRAIHRLVSAAEYKDAGTRAHATRIGAYCRLIAGSLGMSDREAELIGNAAPMHDVGKVSLPDSILLKPGPLTEQERDVMERHTEIGSAILADDSSELMRLASVIALTHHERWDGAGYPRGLSGEDIPIAGRICAAADAFDVLAMPRPYRDPLPLGQVLWTMNQGRGREFDPQVVDAILNELGPIEDIRHGVGPGA